MPVLFFGCPMLVGINMFGLCQHVHICDLCFCRVSAHLCATQTQVFLLPSEDTGLFCLSEMPGSQGGPLTDQPALLSQPCSHLCQVLTPLSSSLSQGDNAAPESTPSLTPRCLSHCGDQAGESLSLSG